MKEEPFLRLESIDGAILKRMIITATNVLEENKGTVDALNVFPVPDGDTGTNMSLTLSAASREVQNAPDNSASRVAEAVALGSLMGARGNSGVILSQLFRGFSRGLEGKVRVSPTELAWAFQEGVTTAYKAVMKPVEGTILTVARESARVALASARQGGDILTVMEATYQQAEQALAKTPELLPVLKKAGVVDSGGKGLVFIFSGYLEALRGTERTRKDISPARTVDFTISEEMSDIRFPYDTEFLIRGSGLGLDRIRETLAEWGDCLLVVGTPELAKIHIHTDNPGRVLDYCIRQGELIQIEIKNMKEQHADLKSTAHHAEPRSEAPKHGSPHFGAAEGDGLLGAIGEGGLDEATEPQEDEPGAGVVAIAAGEGLGEIFRSLGVSEVVHGGQTMNPSTQDLLDAIGKVRTRTVFVLPNNKNIILTAQQAAELTDRDVRVVPTKFVPQGIAAMLAWQAEADPDKNLKAMTRASESIQTGEVTYAVRTTQFGDLEIKEGDILGLWNGQVKAIGRGPEEVLKELLAGMMDQGGEIVTIYAGNGIAEERSAALVDDLRRQYSDCEIELHYGGQPLYYYLFSVE